MKRSVYPAALLALALLASPLVAQDMSMGPDEAFEVLDADGNGELTRDEMSQHRAARFGAVDTDGDGALNLAELTAQAQARAESHARWMLDTFDANADGALSADEMPQPRHEGRMFKKADLDGNGSLSAEEFTTARAQMREMSRKHAGHKAGKN